MGYVIAAYAVVLGTLVAYGLRLQATRRALKRAEASQRQAARGES